MLYWLANHNFFDRYTFIRRIQCKLFGHDWYAWQRQGNKGWCAWCVTKTSAYPKMRKVK